MPADAINSKMRIITATDAANPAMVIGSWGGFLRSNGTWSCQLVLGRALLTPEDSTIPKNELSALTGGSNMTWLVRNSLKEWVDQYILISDSVIALCWVSSDKKQLSLFHRNRALQVRRGIEMDKVFHVDTSNNPSDIGTRPDLVTLDDVTANSKWISGCKWMQHDVDVAVKSGILKPVSKLRLQTKEEQDDYQDGCVFDIVPEVLTRGHVLNQRRISQIQERASYSQYLLLRTKFTFRKVVRIYSYVLAFVCKTRQSIADRTGNPVSSLQLDRGRTKFSLFLVNSVSLSYDESSLHVQLPLSKYTYFAEYDTTQSPPGYFASSQTEKQADVVHLTDKYINLSLTYLYRKAALEVKKFNSNKLIDKISVEQDGILLSKSRILSGLSFAELGGLELSDLPVLGINSSIPIVDRFSPLAYAISQHVHWNVAHHKGIETCHRYSLQNSCILQGMSLYKELAADCMWCMK